MYLQDFKHTVKLTLTFEPVECIAPTKIQRQCQSWPLNPWPTFHRIPLIINDLCVKFESDYAKNVLYIMSTRFPKQSTFVSLYFWPTEHHKLRKTFGKFFRSYSELLSKLGAISFQEYVSKGITHPVFYGELVYKLRRVKSESNFISSGSKIVKPRDHREDYRSCAWPFYSLMFVYHIFMTSPLWLAVGPQSL